MIETKTSLLPFQVVGYEKLIKLKVGALYMGMGTGKTRTAIELIKTRFNKGKVNHIVWFCPCSVKKNLEKDIEKHTTGMIENTTIVGIESISMSDRTYLEILKLVKKYNCFLIVDESNLVKNHLALRTRRIQALAETCEYRLILNGTPVTRNEVDLYSQWCIVDKRIFGYRSFYSFARNHIETDQYGKLVRVLNVNYLTDKIAPYSYEVSKEDVLKDLPEKVYSDSWFELDYDQFMAYQDILWELTDLLDDYNEATVYRLLTALRFVVSGRKVTYDRSFKKLTHKPYFKDYKDNPRVQMLDYYLNTLEGKYIIWCKYHFEIDDIKKLLEERGISYVEFHGGVSQKQRNTNLERFEKEDVQVMLGNKVSGGYGLNLQFCNQMIYYSPDFNWGTSKQSEDRIHRLGQEQTCFYYSIYSDTGIDRLISKCLNNKEDLDKEIRKMLNKKNIMEVLGDKDRPRNKAKRKTNK